MTSLPPLFALQPMQFLFGVALFLTAVFLILLVLVQRGRGGGLTGALGGAGGQSAFGAKAGDTFTRITMVAAGFWILLCAASIIVLQDSGESRFLPGAGATLPEGAEVLRDAEGLLDDSPAPDPDSDLDLEP